MQCWLLHIVGRPTLRVVQGGGGGGWAGGDNKQHGTKQKKASKTEQNSQSYVYTHHIDEH